MAYKSLEPLESNFINRKSGTDFLVVFVPETVAATEAAAADRSGADIERWRAPPINTDFNIMAAGYSVEIRVLKMIEEISELRFLVVLYIGRARVFGFYWCSTNLDSG